MSDQIVCPSDEELRAMVTGQSASPTVEAHLETCVECGQRHEEQAAAKRTALDWHPHANTALTPTPVLQPPEYPASFGDKYMVVGKLGTGGQGEVFRAIDRNLKLDVAIKWSP